LSKDANDFKEASDTVKHIFTSNLLRQTALLPQGNTWECARYVQFP